MTVRELLIALVDKPLDAPVLMCYDDGQARDEEITRVEVGNLGVELKG